MGEKSHTYYVLLLIVVLFAFGCKKEQPRTTILPDSMLTLEVGYEQGDFIDPFSLDTLDFSGFPGAIGYFQEVENLPFLVIGKDLDRKDDVDCNYIASITLNFQEESKLFGLAFPVSEKHKTKTIVDYNSLTTSEAAFKLWLNDWFANAYRNKGLINITWGNELDLYRKILTNRK